MFASVREGNCGLVNFSGYLSHQILGFEGKCINVSGFFFFLVWGKVIDLIMKAIFQLFQNNVTK